MFKKVFLAGMIFILSLGVSFAEPGNSGHTDVGSVPPIIELA